MLLLMRALLAAAVLSGAACSVYDSPLPYSNTGGDSSVARDACVAATETCNGKDDDCDGVADEAEAATKDCRSRLLNTDSVCQGTYCLKVGPCHAGFYNCDGMPDNGCESACPCDVGGCDDRDGGP